MKHFHKTKGLRKAALAQLHYDRYSNVDVAKFVSELFDCEPCNTHGSYKFKWDYLKEEILSKYCSPSGDPQERATKAIQKMLDSEDACRQINNHGFLNEPELESVLFMSRRLISEVLGVHTYSIVNDSSFSGGASFLHRRIEGSPYFKYKHYERLGVTARLYNKGRALISSTPPWASAWDGSLPIVPGNRIDTVPKKSDIDRCIAIEPELNNQFQRGYGNHIRRRLKRFGVNLNDQSKNQDLARIGAISGSLATIDLKSASDSISDRLVFDLLPPEWYTALDDCRSHYGKLPSGKILKWEKFSSMGNGFTFELESLIFWAITVACVRYIDLHQPTCTTNHEISVYGDDIICPSYAAPMVIRILRAVGFETNPDKTFIDGPFRESCGKHYYRDVDVSPFYIRKPIDSQNRVLWLLNRLRLWSYDERMGVCDPSVYSLWLKYKRKHVLPAFFGGTDVDSTSSLASPDDTRFSITQTFSRVRTVGLAGLLYSLQNGNNPLYEGIRYGSESSYSNVRQITQYSRNCKGSDSCHVNGDESCYLSIPTKWKYKVVHNNLLHSPTLKILFPTEVGGMPILDRQVLP